MKILLVCLGNICRSPIAHGIMEARAAAHGLEWQIDSAGTSSWHEGEKPDSRAIEIARQHGIDISRQRSRPFRRADFEEFDKIMVMDAHNYRDVIALAPSDAHRDKVDLIMNYVQPNRNLGVPDPYYDDKAFEPVFQLLDRAVLAAIRQLTAKQ